MKVRYCLSVMTEESSVYFESFDEHFPVPRPGEEIFVGGEAIGWWTVERVDYSLPSKGALSPGFWIAVYVKWSTTNNRPAPVYDEDMGWVQSKSD